MDTGVTLFLLTAGFGLSFAYAIILLVTRYKQCAPDEILVIYGRVDGGRSSKCIHGGGTLVWPLVQDWAKLSLIPMTIEIPVDNAVSVDDIKMNIKPIAVGLLFGVGMALALKSWLLGIMFGVIFYVSLNEAGNKKLTK